jgi:hypothetical protein
LLSGQRGQNATHDRKYRRTPLIMEKTPQKTPL